MVDVYGGVARDQAGFNKHVLKRLNDMQTFGPVQSQGIVGQVESARDQAVAASEQAHQVQSEVALDQMVDPGNLFDYAPIIAQDASLFWTAKQTTPGVAGYEPAGVPKIVEWFADGFTVEASAPGMFAIGNRRTFRLGPEVKYNTRFSAAYQPSSSPWPVGVAVRLGLWVGPYAWSAVDGPIGQDQPQIGSPTANPNPGSDREFYSPDSTRAVSTFPGDPERTTWRPAVTFWALAAGDRFTVRRIRMQVIAGTLDFSGGATVPGSAIPDDAIERRMIAAGAVGADELDPSLQFGVADGAVTTPKLANNAVTRAKVEARPTTGITWSAGFMQHPTFTTSQVTQDVSGIFHMRFAVANASASSVTYTLGVPLVFGTIPAAFRPVGGDEVRLAYGANVFGPRTFIRIKPNGDCIFEPAATGTVVAGGVIVLGELSWWV